MIRYNSNNQLSIEDFQLPVQAKLDANNRWVQLAKALPWDKMASIYYKSMSSKMGAPGIDARIIIGAMIIKHKEKLDDRGAIIMISENPYMQYFLGLTSFTSEPVFDPSLYVTIRKRLGVEEFDRMSKVIIEIATGEKKNTVEKGENTEDTDKGNTTESKETQEKKPLVEERNNGKLQMDATVSDAYIKYPTDIDLLNDSREKAEELIDLLCEKLKLGVKPRTYRREARRKYLNIVKKKSKSKKEIRQGIRQQLGFLRRDINHLYTLLDRFDGKRFPLTKQQQKYLFVMQHVYSQQQEMYKSNKHSCLHRIVSIHQPHVRPIVRGKAKAHVEFGAKVGVSLDKGYSRIDNLSWEAYNESTDLPVQVERYRELHGHYPELVQVDRIYLNRDNRNWLKDRHIRYTGKPLGRPPIEELTYYQKRKRRKEAAERNQIEGKFGQGKNGYNLNKIRAKLQSTSESWIAALFFVMNLVKFAKGFLLTYFYALRKHLSEIINLIFRPGMYPTKLFPQFVG